MPRPPRLVRLSRLSILPLLLTAVLAVGIMTAGTPAATAATAARGGTSFWSTQLQFDDNGTAWSKASFAALKADGLTTVEINMFWNNVEPSPGTFDFTELDTTLANAAAAGIKVVPIFWESGWTGSPASWITDREVTAAGAAGAQPAWWNLTDQSEYFTYVVTTIAHISRSPGYGGSTLDYGFLDAQWDINGGAGGWAPADIAEFQNVYLPRTYRSIAAFNAAWGTSYASFGQVPASGDVYQQFRAWSVGDTYGRLTAAVRRVSSGPLFYYYGGHLANAPAYANNPDTFFALAHRYDVTIILDSAQSTGLALTFGSLARAYGVRLAQEWTAPNSDNELAAAAVDWISNYGIGLPEGGGEDFFIHDGTQKDVIGFPVYVNWLPELQGLSGSYPSQPYAAYVDMSSGYGDQPGNSLLNAESVLASAWASHQSGFAVVTSQEVASGVVRLSSFRGVLPLNGTDPALTAYQAAGGQLLTSASQLGTAYASLSAPFSLKTVPVVAADHRSASITLAEVNTNFGYTGSVTVSPAGLTLRPGVYHLVDSAGTALPQRLLPGDLVCAPVTMASATLAQWRMVPGPAPSGTPSSCPAAGSGATSVSATADSNSGLVFLGVGQTGQGSDGNLTQVTQDGVPALATWTSAQSGVAPANVYLQIDPSSAVYAASSVNVTVTYWASAGQGFQPQYDGTGGAYENGPVVTSPGTGTWATSTVTITGAQFGEEQNLSADLRLAVTNPSAPLIVSSVTLSVAG